MRRLLQIATSITVCVILGICADTFDTYVVKERCCAAFRQTLIDKPAGLPLEIHEYSIRHLFPGARGLPDPRDLRLSVNGAFTLPVTTLLIWAASLCCSGILCHRVFTNDGECTIGHS